MAIALFILGHAASGKTTLAKSWIKSRMRKGEHWCLMDKDDTGEILAPELMQSMGLDPNDRDSSNYKNKVRDLEYLACLNVAKEQLKLGINVVLPGPWTKELKSQDIFNPDKLMFPSDTQLEFVYLDIPEDVIKERILKRKNLRDNWKVNNWSLFTKTLKINPILREKGITIFESNEDYDNQEKVMENLIYSKKVLAMS